MHTQIMKICQQKENGVTTENFKDKVCEKIFVLFLCKKTFFHGYIFHNLLKTMSVYRDIIVIKFIQI